MKPVNEYSTRDAIHVAIAPVIASCDLAPGTRVGIDKEGKADPKQKHIGIINPFLDESVRAGKHVWLFMFPETVINLTHHWMHPAFNDDLATSHGFIEKLAKELGLDFDNLISISEKNATYGEYTMDNSERYKKIPSNVWQEFWKHFHVVTGIKVEDDSYAPFTCSC